MAADDEAKAKPKPAMTIKLMINKKNRLVMYAEAGNDFVDLLFSFLVLPTGAIAKQALLSDPKLKGCCIANLYNSVESLSNTLKQFDKAVLLDPMVVSTIYCSEILNIQAPPPPKPTPPPTYYVCSNASSRYNTHNLSTQPSGRCTCGYSVDRQVNFVDPSRQAVAVAPAQGNGYVKKKVNFVITDDLKVIPVNSTATIVNLWNNLQLKDPSELEEKNVPVGSKEVMGLLRAAMVSKSALNDVFEAQQKFLPMEDMDTESARLALQQILLKLLQEEHKLQSKNAAMRA